MAASRRLRFLTLRLTNGTSQATSQPGGQDITLTLLPNNNELVTGGDTVNGGTGIRRQNLTSTELYNLETGTWSTTGSVGTVASGHTATLLSNSEVLVAGLGYHRPFGIAAAELYHPSAANVVAALQNISTLVDVRTGDDVLIGGFIISGTRSKRIALRAIGPSLVFDDPYHSLPDPTLELHYPNNTVVTNDNWQIDDQTGDSQEAAIRATKIPPSNNLESAMVRNVSPGVHRRSPWKEQRNRIRVDRSIRPAAGKPIRAREYQHADTSSFYPEREGSTSSSEE